MSLLRSSLWWRRLYPGLLAPTARLPGATIVAPLRGSEAPTARGLLLWWVPLDESRARGTKIFTDVVAINVFSNDVNVRLLPVWLWARGGSCRLNRDFRGGRADIRQGVFQTLAAGGTDSGRIMSFRHHAPGYARDAFQAFCPSGLAGARLRRHSLLRGVRICRCATFQRRGLGGTRRARSTRDFLWREAGEI